MGTFLEVARMFPNCYVALCTFVQLFPTFRMRIRIRELLLISENTTSTTSVRNMNMFSSASRSPTWDFQSMLKTSGISTDVQQHLVRVYATLSACVLTAALSAGTVLALTSGSAADNSSWMGLLAFFSATGGSIWLQMEPSYNHQKRFGILMMVAASMGVSMSALIEMALDMDPTILITALYVFY